MEEDATFENLLESVTNLIKLLENSVKGVVEKIAEVILPSPETLLVQFSGRTVFMYSEPVDERLTASYWLSLPNDEGENENENVIFSKVLCRIC